MDMLAAERWDGKAVVLLDLDAFFASVEQLDHPEWRGKPLIVGGSADKRGVVSTCSYEARAYGVCSAMPSSVARSLCPDAIWVPGNFARYREMSAKVMSIMTDESPFIQQVSIDEAFLDITPSRYRTEHPAEVAARIQQRVSELGITCSIGLATSKTVAKIASEEDKPQGLTIVYPGRERDYLAHLPTGRMSGIGPVAQEMLRSYGIRTLGELASAEDCVLEKVFGKNAFLVQQRCQGVDTRPVQDDTEQKSLSCEMSFAEDLSDISDVEAAVKTLCAKLGRRMRSKGLVCKGVVLKLRHGNRSIHTSTARLARPSDSEFEFADALLPLIGTLLPKGTAVRLVGVGAIDLGFEDFRQDNILDVLDDDAKAANRRQESLVQATDAIRNRFGEASVSYGRELKTKGRLTGSSSKNPADYK